MRGCRRRWSISILRIRSEKATARADRQGRGGREIGGTSMDMLGWYAGLLLATGRMR